MFQRSSIATATAALLAIHCIPFQLSAQSGAGTIQGTVQDATASAIPAASVQALNQATGVAIETTSNAAGFFAIKGLTAGAYKVTFSAPGMCPPRSPWRGRPPSANFCNRIAIARK